MWLLSSVGSLFVHRSSTSATAATAQSNHRFSLISSLHDYRRSSSHDPKRRSSDDVGEAQNSSFILQLSPSCPCPSSAEHAADHITDDVHLNHHKSPAAAAKTAAVGNVAYLSPTASAPSATQIANSEKILIT